MTRHNATHARRHARHAQTHSKRHIRTIRGKRAAAPAPKAEKAIAAAPATLFEVAEFDIVCAPEDAEIVMSTPDDAFVVDDF